MTMNTGSTFACFECGFRDPTTTVREDLVRIDRTMGLKDLGGEVYACPKCGQRYERIVDLAGEDLRSRDYDLYHFHKLDPVLPRSPLPARTTTPAVVAPAAESMEATKYRCPKCRALEANLNLDKSVFENKYMECLSCGYHSYITWDDEDEWLIAAQNRAEREPAVPAKPAAPPMPLIRATVAPAKPAAPPRTAPTAAAPQAKLGCARCAGMNAAAAWSAVEYVHLSSLVSEVHFGIDLTQCECGQHFVVVFTERIDYRDGEDDQTWLALPLTEVEAARLMQADRSDAPGLVNEIGGARRFLARSNHADAPWWRDGGFSILPHD